MKKLLFVAVAFILLVSAPAVSFSQGFSLLPGNFFGGQSACGDGATPWLDPLSFYVGWGVAPTNPRFTFDSGGGGVSSLSHRWPLNGLWLGVAEKLNVSERCAINAEAWWLIPSTATGTEESVVGITTFIPGIGTAPGVFFTTPAALSVNWSTRPDWWYLDGRLVLKPCGGNFGILGGFRYDHFSTRFEFPFNVTTGFVFDPSNQADITVNSYIPYVGFEYSCMGAGSGLCMRLIGFPWVPADVLHSETGEAGPGIRGSSTGSFNSGRYFIEFFGEYSRTVFGGAGIGAWFRWQDLSGRGPITTTLNPSGLAISDAFVFDRNTIAFGGKATLNFNMPF